MKKSAILTLILLLLAIPVNAYTQDAITIVINNVPQTYEVPPQIIKDRIMLPLRAVCESLDIAVDYDDETTIVTMIKDNTIITHVVSTKTITINGVASTFDTESTIVESRVLVSLRMIAEAINAKVDWIPETQTAVIDAPVGQR